MAPALGLPEPLAWKLIGAATWHAAVVGVANFCFALVVPPSLYSLVQPAGALTHLFLYGLQFAALLGHNAVLSSNEFAPVTFPKLGIHGRTWISLVLTRVLVRGRTLAHLIGTATFLGSTLASGVMYVTLYPRLKLGTPFAAWSLTYGALLAVCYSCSHLVRCCDVLSYPVLQRHRWFRLKERVLSVLLTAASTTGAALGLTLLANRGLLLYPVLLYGWAVSGCLCCVCWAAGGALLDIVFTERLHFARAGDPDPNAPLLAELASSNTVMQDLALLDLALTCEAQGGEAAWRRAALFADESGRAAWNPLASYLLAELRDFTTALAAALPNAAAEAAAASRGGGAGRAGGGGGGGGGGGPAFSGGGAAAAVSAAAVRWNVLRMSPSTGLRAVSREQDLAAWNVRSKYFRISWCLRSLAGLACAAARGEDRYGVVLLCEPALPDILAALLAAVLALQQYTKFVAATRSRRPSSLERLARGMGLVSTALSGRVTNVSLQPVEEVAFALEGTGRGCVSRLALYYGDKLREVLKEARSKPACGSAAELGALLGGVLSCQVQA